MKKYMVTLILSCQKLTIFDQKVKSCDVWVIFFCKYLIERASADWHGITIVEVNPLLTASVAGSPLFLSRFCGVFAIFLRCGLMRILFFLTFVPLNTNPPSVRDTFNISFYCREQCVKDGVAPVEVCVNVRGKRTVFRIDKFYAPAEFKRKRGQTT